MVAEVTFQQQQAARIAVGNTILSLSTAAVSLLGAREGSVDPTYGALINALREDFTRMIQDVEALKAYLV